MTQPALGLVSAAIVIAIALGFISVFDLATFNGWVAFAALAFIPMSIVTGITWGANPPFVAGLRQPAKGLTLVAVTLVVAAIVSPLTLWTVGEGVSPPGPIPTHFAIIAVVFTFWLVIMMGGWPLTAAIRGAVPAGLAVLAGSYAVTYAVFRIFFNYDFMQGAPVYLSSAPQGQYMAIQALVFCVTHVAAMFLVLLFDLWPFTTSPGLMKQPALGVVWTVTTVVITAAAMWTGVTAMATDPMIFLTRVTVPFIFGSILVLNMFQNSLLASLRQPLKGIANAAVAISFGVGLAGVYRLAGPTLMGGPLVSGPPAYDYEIWLANALLAITFPLLVVEAVYFDFWPFKKQATTSPQTAARPRR
jgi:hypothetical protein